MIRITELLSDEDGVTSINKMEFASIKALCAYKFFCSLVSQGSVVEEPGNVDNFGEPIEQKFVDQFKKEIAEKKGVLYDWSVEYDTSTWFMEIDEEHKAELLTISHVWYDDYGNLQDVESSATHKVDCTKLREIASAM